MQLKQLLSVLESTDGLKLGPWVKSVLSILTTACRMLIEGSVPLGPVLAYGWLKGRRFRRHKCTKGAPWPMWEHGDVTNLGDAVAQSVLGVLQVLVPASVLDRYLSRPNHSFLTGCRSHTSCHVTWHIPGQQGCLLTFCARAHHSLSNS